MFQQSWVNQTCYWLFSGCAVGFCAGVGGLAIAEKEFSEEGMLSDISLISSLLGAEITTGFISSVLFGCGGWIRTSGFLLMRKTRCPLLYSAVFVMLFVLYL